MRVGIDVLRERDFSILRGKRVGLLSHQAAVSMDGSTSAQLLRRALGGSLVALYGPEHGFLGQAGAGEEVASRQHPDWGVPVYSLYGRHRAPTGEMLRGVDVMVIDLQDLGVRCYTYLATIRNMLLSCAAHQVKVVVVDRAIPLPAVVDGPMTQPEFLGFVAPCALPMVYGMTPAECASWVAVREAPTLELQLIAMEGWHRRDAEWDGTRPAFMPPSPGIKSWESAMCYGATVFTEALPALECGRDTNMAFRVLGAPWMKAESFCELPELRAMKGVTFRPYFYQCGNGMYKGREIQAIRLTVTDPATFLPVTCSIVLLRALLESYGMERVWYGARNEWFDMLYGESRTREWLCSERPLTPLFKAWRMEMQPFLLDRERRLFAHY